MDDVSGGMVTIGGDIPYESHHHKVGMKDESASITLKEEDSEDYACNTLKDSIRRKGSKLHLAIDLPLDENESGDEELDLSTFDMLSHSQSTYNDSHSIIYTQHSALDLFYDATYDSTVRMRDSRYTSTLTPSSASALQANFDTTLARIKLQQKQQHGKYAKYAKQIKQAKQGKYGQHGQHTLVGTSSGISETSSRSAGSHGPGGGSGPRPSSATPRSPSTPSEGGYPTDHGLPSQWQVTSESGQWEDFTRLKSKLTSRLSKRSNLHDPSPRGLSASPPPPPSSLSSYHPSSLPPLPSSPSASSSGDPEIPSSFLPLKTMNPSILAMEEKEVLAGGEKEKEEKEKEKEAEEFGLRSELEFINPAIPNLALPSEIAISAPIPSEYTSIPAAKFFSNQKVAGFTVLQAIQFLFENSMQ